MRFSISKQKGENSSGRKERSSLSAAIQTVAFIGGIIAVVTAIFFGIGFFKKDSDTAKKPEYQPLSFYKLSSFEYYTPPFGEKAEPEKQVKNKIPDEIMALNGQKVSLSGFMLPYQVDDEGNVKEFSLNGNFDMCYFGAPVSLNEWVMVKMDENLRVKYTHQPIKVSGTFEVGEEFKDGQVTSLYRLKLEKLGDYKK
jgi:hypothetical protein